MTALSPDITGHDSQWEIDKLDLDAYLARIDHPHVRPSAEALRSLHEAHVRTIPFENVDVILGTHQGLGLDVIADKLVRRFRGGYCFEHALLFAAVLERLGFTVQRRMARVQPQSSGSRTHMLLAVYLDGEQYLADVGFGAGILHAMPLRDGAVVDQAGRPHRLTFDGGLWTLSKRTDDGWEPLHESDESPQRISDYEISHHYVSTHPKSPFTGKLIVFRPGDGVSRRLVGDKLTVTHADGREEETTVAPEDIGEVLGSLDVVLTEDELAALAAR